MIGRDLYLFQMDDDTEMAHLRLVRSDRISLTFFSNLFFSTTLRWYEDYDRTRAVQ